MGKSVMNKGTVCWLMASAGLIGVIMLQVNDEAWLMSPVTAATVEPAQQQNNEDEGFVVRSSNPDWLDMIVERPLFSKSRRPFSLPEQRLAAAPEPKARELTLTLTGTLLAGRSRIALLAHPTNGLLRLRQGQKVDGWRVDEIHEDEVRLRRGQEITLLSLRKGAFNVSRQPTVGTSLHGPSGV